MFFFTETNYLKNILTPDFPTKNYIQKVVSDRSQRVDVNGCKQWVL